MSLHTYVLNDLKWIRWNLMSFILLKIIPPAFIIWTYRLIGKTMTLFAIDWSILLWWHMYWIARRSSVLQCNRIRNTNSTADRVHSIFAYAGSYKLGHWTSMTTSIANTSKSWKCNSFPRVVPSRHCALSLQWVTDKHTIWSKNTPTIEILARPLCWYSMQ